MTAKKLFLTAGAICVLSGCVRDPICDNCQQGQITVTSDWTRIGNGIAAPVGYTVSMDGTLYRSDADTYTIPETVKPDKYTLYLYNEPENIVFDGLTASVIPHGDYIDSWPGWLFTGSQYAEIETGKGYDYIVPMLQRVRELTLIIEPGGGAGGQVSGITGVLSGVAGSYYMFTDTRGNPSEIELEFEPIESGPDAGKWQSTVHLLGITGHIQTLTGMITFEGGVPDDLPLSSDLSIAMRGFNDNMSEPFILGGTTVETNTASGFTATIQDWSQTVIDKVSANRLNIVLTGAGLEADLRSIGVDPASVDRLGLIGGALAATDFDYLNNQMTALTDLDMQKVMIENNTLPESAFENNTHLRKIVLPETIVAIGTRAFFSCEQLKSIEIPNSVTTIAYSVFANCTSIESVTLPENDDYNKIDDSIFLNCESLQSIEIPNNVTRIGSDVFRECISLKSIEIPNNVTLIGSNAFHECISLKSIEMPNSLEAILTSAFEGCISLITIELPDGTTFIGANCFKGCESLKSISLPSTLITIEHSAFEECKSLESIEIPNSVTDIYGSAFYKCQALRSMNFPANDKYTTIEAQLFSECGSLESITIPSNVTFIGSNAFWYCWGLTSVTCFATTPPRAEMDIFDRSYNSPIYVPAGSVDAYKSAEVWSNYASDIKAIP